MKHTSSHYFIVCFIEETQVNIGVGEVTEVGPQIIATAKPKEWQDEMGLSDAVEVALDELQDHVSGVDEVLFGLPEDWVDGADIKDGHKEILKKLSHKLSWKPLGFVVSLEAVSRYLAQKKGIVSALFFDMTPSQFRLVRFDHGNVVQQEMIGRSDDFIADVKEGLARFQLETIPSVFFFFSSLLSSDQIEELKQQFLHYDWLKEKTFSQFPSVEHFSLSQVLEAVCIMGGGEALKLDHSTRVLPTQQDLPQHKAEPDEFGFTEVSSAHDEPVGSSFGVPITQEAMKKVPLSAKQDDSDLAIALDEDDMDKAEEETPKKRWSFPFFGKGKKKEKEVIVPKAVEELPSRPKKKTSFRFIPHGIALIVLLLLFVVGGAYAYMLKTFSVMVEATLQTKSITKNLEVTLDPDIKATDPEKAILKATIKSKEATGTQETSTTGSKIIGEKAKGKITIFNKTENDKTLSSGTEVKADGKVFLIDDEVKIASASITVKEENGSEVKKTDYGKTDVAVTAKEIGAEFNLDKEKEFSIANFGTDTYSGKNEKEFSGGSSREIQAVSKDDYQRVLSSLKKDLTEEAQKKLQDEKETGEYVVLTGKAKVSDEEYSAKIGDETNTLKLTATVTATAFSYFANDLKPIAQQYLLSEVPDQGVLLEDTVGILSKQSDASGSGTLTLDAELSAEYAPPTFSEDWVSSILGKSVPDAKRLLEDKEEIQSTTFTFTPSWTRNIFNKLPSDAKRVQLNKKIE